MKADVKADMKLLKYSADRKTLAFVSCYFVLLAFGYSLGLSSLWVTIPLVLVLCYFSFVCAVITHNSIHVPIFSKNWLNRVFQVVLTVTYGHPVSSFVPGHNLSHHKHTQTRRDVMRTSKARFKWNFLNQFLFAAIVGKSITKADIDYIRYMKVRRPEWFHQVVIEYVSYFLISLALLLVNWKCFIVFYMIPHIYAAWGIVGINFVQHDGCDADSEFNHSRNWTGPILNFLTFNNGYHGMHHMKASLHWSKLPEAHEKYLAPFNHPNLNQENALKFLWTAYIYPGKRLRYDGTPLKLPDEGPDEPWIPALEDAIQSSGKTLNSRLSAIANGS